MEDLHTKDLHTKNLIKDENSDEILQYVTFVIGDEIYGVEAIYVHEIVKMTKIIHVPNTMDFMKGFINLRGKVVPAIDMRLKFNMEEKDYDDVTAIIIVEVKDRLIGMITDSVSDVISMADHDLQDIPHFSLNIETDFISSIGKRNDEMIILLDISRILSMEEMEDIEQKQEQEQSA